MPKKKQNANTVRGARKRANDSKLGRKRKEFIVTDSEDAILKQTLAALRSAAS